MHLFLIRHGETDWNNEHRIQGNTDTPLNANGIAQAKQLAARIAGEKIAALYASPLARARATAEIIADKAGVALILDDRLKEKGLGDLEGLTVDEFELRYPDLYRGWISSADHFPLPGEESPAQLRERIVAFLDDLRTRHTNGARVAIVTHGGTISMFVSTLIGLAVNQRSPFWFDNASITLADLTGARPRVKLLNDTCHLANGELRKP
jgi:broad specificity phosphatase PhoE